MTSLASPLPARNVGSPPTSGGFYKFPRSAKSFTKSTGTPKTELPSLVLLLDKPDRDFRSEVQRIAKVKTPARKNFKYFHKFESLSASAMAEDQEIKLTDISPAKTLPLLNSFSSHSCFLGIDNRKSVEIQTEPPPLMRKEFVDLKDFRNWGTVEVDPFVKDLRKALMTHKPDSIELYVMAYCQARLRGDPVPETVEANKAAAQSKKVASRNTVTPATSLIRLRNAKTKISTEAQNQEDGAMSGDEQPGAGVQERVSFDYSSSMSEDSGSEAGTEQSF